MELSKSFFIKMKLLTSIIFCSTLISCQGQEHKTNDKLNIFTDSTTEKSLVNKRSEVPSAFPDFENQISDVVRVMFQDSRGDIWFGAQGGVFLFSNNSLTYIDSIKSESGKRVTIKDIAEDKDGTIWLGHTDGISSVDGKLVKNYYVSDGLISNDVWCIATDRSNKVWIGTIEGVCKFDGKNFTPFELPEGIKDTTVGVSSSMMIHNIMEDSKGRMWFCTNGGIYIKDKTSLTNISEKDGLHTPFVNEVIETHTGDFLISTSQGLYKYQKGILAEVTGNLFEETKGTGTIVEDSNGNIWFNCSRSIYSLKNADLTEYRISKGNYGPLTFQIYEDQQKRLWFVGYGGAFRLENGKFLNITKDGPW